MWKKATTFLVATVATLFLITGCTTPMNVQEEVRSPSPPPSFRVESAPPPTIIQRSSGAEIGYNMPDEVALGVPYEYTLVVRNIEENFELTDVEVVQNFSDGFQLQASSPKAKMLGNTAVWNLGDLGIDESRTITVQGIATQTGVIEKCAKIDYKRKWCDSVLVVEPKLELTKTAPSEVLSCDPIPIRLVVTNSGSGDLRNVEVRDNLPGGMETADGQGSAYFTIDLLASGESREFVYDAKATSVGEYTHEAVANSGKLRDEASAFTRVIEPVLSIRCTAPEVVYVGRPIRSTYTVANTGNGPANDLVVESSIPAGTSFLKANYDGVYDGSGTVVWRIPSLDPNKKIELEVTVKATEITTGVGEVQASSFCAEPVSDRCSTEIKGIPAILLEVVDLEDPIEVGSDDTYVIAVTNQGSAYATNISITCILEENQEYSYSEGPTTANVQNNIIRFAPLRELAPKDKVAWKLTVKSIKAGDVRFKVVMTSDQLQRPVEETEATNIY